MITFHGEEKEVSYISVRKKGQKFPHILTEKSDPKELYAALYEMAATVNRLHEEAKAK